jgi:hypothetical protein
MMTTAQTRAHYETQAELAGQTPLHEAAKQAARTIQDQVIDAVQNGNGFPTTDSMAAVIYQAVRNAREI